MCDVTEVDVLSVEFPSSSETNKLIAIYIKRKQKGHSILCCGILICLGQGSEM